MLRSRAGRNLWQQRQERS